MTDSTARPKAVPNATVTLLDCTLRDGGYYNQWDFPDALVQDYIRAMEALGVDCIELGFRFTPRPGFLGPCAYTTDAYIERFERAPDTQIAVMINAADYLDEGRLNDPALAQAFPRAAADSPVSLVRIACHFAELERALPMIARLAARGYRTALNLMQIGTRDLEEIARTTAKAQDHPLEVLYFADSLGNIDPSRTRQIVQAIRHGWHGSIGIHTHDNMGNAIANTLAAVDAGVDWADATVTGMGRGPGNAQTELLATALQQRRTDPGDLIPLLRLIRTWFAPAKARYGWGTNPYYYLAGAHGIHPTYVQHMLDDHRYAEEDIIAVLEHLKTTDARSYSLKNLDLARRFYHGEPIGGWDPSNRLADREVLILGTGPGVAQHRAAVESYIRQHRPLVIALNIREDIAASLIDLRVACHPVRLLSDAPHYAGLAQPLILPRSMLPPAIVDRISARTTLDFGLRVQDQTFEFHPDHGVLPRTLVLAYALALANSGRAARIRLAGFDGYAPGDPRQEESQSIFSAYLRTPGALPIEAITPTSYAIPACSVYSLSQ